MLEVLKTRKIRKKTAGGKTKKVADLKGYYAAVNRVTDARRISNCQQWANPQAEMVQLRILYSISSGDGFVHIERIDVLCQENSWSCYYDLTNLRVGRKPNGALCYNFLEENAIEPVLTALSTYELHNRKDDAHNVLREMTKQGPSAFLKTGRGREEVVHTGT